jgi:alpha-mannosidase
MTIYQCTLVSHTHWDRAWYVTFQEYRIRLVRLVDRLIELLNTRPDFTVFMLDGQMSVLEDYLEVRPERAEILQAFAKSGRVQVGPWYVLADEFLVSPESLIRNLMIGREMGKAFGGVMQIGYVPDGFGHIAQLPQILRNFGIDNALFWRGMGAEGDQLGTEFNWCAPDGSCTLTILMPWGYHNVTNLGYGVHWGDVSQMQFNAELAQRKIARAVDKLLPMANTDALLLMNGIDHAEAEPRIPDIIAAANEALDGKAFIHHGTLRDHVGRVRDYVARTGKALGSFTGEFRWGRYSEILQGVYSTRIHLKQENFKCETLMERQVEPLTALAWLSGAPVPDGTTALTWKAWRWLLLNHPHDDIYGSGIDEVHEEMKYRYSQCKQIGDALVRDSLRQIAVQLDYSAQPGTPVIAFNPLGWARKGCIEAIIDFDFDDPKANNFQLVNNDGTIIPHQVISDEEAFWMEVLKANRKRRMRVLFALDLPACGFGVVYAQAADEPAAAVNDLRVYERGAENDYAMFAITDDGGLTVTDKLTGAVYSGLNHIVDWADVGDEYTFCPLKGETPVTTKGNKPEVTLLEAGPCRATFRIEWIMLIPAEIDSARATRSTKIVPTKITSDVSIYAGQPGIYFSTHLNNQSKDHKLTVTFPTGLNPKFAHVDESFMVSERALDLPDSSGWVEDPTSLMHQRTFCDLSDGARGLALLNRGLPSIEVGQDGTIALTLLRCVGWLSRDDLWVRRIAAGPLVPTPGAQCLGEYTYEYAILPHKGDWREVYRNAYGYAAPVVARRADTHAGIDLRDMNITRDDPTQITALGWQREGDLPPNVSLVEVDTPQLVLSALRRGDDDTLLVRVYNIESTPIRSTIRVGVPMRAACRSNMAEETLEGLTLIDGRAVEIEAGSNEVVTIKFAR